MNIALVNMRPPVAVQPKTELPTGNSQGFGNVFGQILSSQSVPSVNVESPVKTEQNLIQDLLSLLDAESIEDAQNLLQTDELLVDSNDLHQLLNKLLSKLEDLQENPDQKQDVWEILANVMEQPQKLVDSILLTLNGQASNKITSPVEAKQAVELLKVVQLIGNKSDLTFKQETTLFDLKQTLETLKENLTNLSLIQGRNSTPVTKAFIQQVVMNQSVTKGMSTEVVTESKETTSVNQGQTITVQTKVETVSMTLPTQKSAQSEEFIKELQKLMNRVQFGQAAGANRLVIKLYPEQLGTIRIELIQKDGILTAKMLASTALGKEMLDTHSGQLRQGLANQNIQIEKLEITQALQDTAKQEKNQGFQDSTFKQHRQHDQQEEDSDVSVSDIQTTFQEFLSEIEV
ncbi:flagellar hook-length control protein FliK [Psychrobacillus sp. MER TA 171]|uniref:flagellar hook-length control protein FliK n=1 Tax=Psychrobacillus sp. MER TA 171 TaxID=2939577 RepID=UPI00204052AD|nr:flagellar hook-length control protein FliK [Psychrobacillus sp. MER TA 171]MCM3356929.1 flagellar hook-length control protein FliK [Psychrobacillus sp. MER TA 171]